MNFVYPSQFIQTLESIFFILANCSENKKRKMFWIKQVFIKDVTHKTYSYQTSSFKTSILLNTVLQNVQFFYFDRLTEQCQKLHYITNNLLLKTYFYTIHIYNFFIALMRILSLWLHPPLFHFYNFILAVHQALQHMKQNRWYIIFDNLDILIYLFALTNLPKHSRILQFLWFYTFMSECIVLPYCTFPFTKPISVYTTYFLYKTL